MCGQQRNVVLHPQPGSRIVREVARSCGNDGKRRQRERTMRISPRKTMLGVLALAVAAPAARAADPIRIGVIAETSAISGVGIPNAAKMAAEEINAAGGVNGQMIEIVDYDDHNSAVRRGAGVSARGAAGQGRGRDRQLYQRSGAGAGALGGAAAHADDHAGRGEQRHHQARARRLRPSEIRLPRLPGLHPDRRRRLRGGERP